MGLPKPKGIEYHYVGEDEQWHIREDAPEWAKKEFAEFMVKIHPKADKDGKITMY